VNEYERGKTHRGAPLANKHILMAGVEIVATYELYNINRTKLKNLNPSHFDPSRL